MLRFGLALALLGLPVGAECRLALALAVDVSRSVDAGDYRIQTEGLAAALEDTEVQAALLSPAGEVALMVYHWSGPRHQEVILPWMLLKGPQDLAAVVAAVRAVPLPKDRQATALGYALVYGAEAMAEAPPCARRVLDVAGDGRNNEGISVESAYRRVDFGDIVVNGLAIGEHEADVDEYYRAEVIRGLGAFVEVAATQEDYPQAIRRKLLRELNGPEIGGLPAVAQPRG
jgi:Protein of unknown function (DUF1194)